MRDAPPTAEEIRLEIEHVAATVKQAHATFLDGAFVDLTGLDGRVTALAGALRRLDRAAGLALVPPLQLLLGDFDALAGEMRRRQGATADELKTISTRNKAAEAYNNPKGNNPKGKGSK